MTAPIPQLRISELEQFQGELWENWAARCGREVIRWAEEINKYTEEKHGASAKDNASSKDESGQ